MIRYRFVIFLIISEGILKGSEAAFLNVPQNEVALQNSTIQFQCRTDSAEPLSWSFTSAGTTDSILIFTRGKLTKIGRLKYMYGVNKSSHGQYNLIINSVDFSHAGKYRCSEESTGAQVEAELSVVESQPICHTNASQTTKHVVVEHDHLRLWCSIGFIGTVHFALEWFRIRDHFVIRRFESLFGDWSTAPSDIIFMTKTQVDYSDNGETYKFRATAATSNSTTQQNTSREVTITWSYTATVLYGPRSLTITANNVTFASSSHLICSADGNPAPKYEWIETATNTTTSGSTLSINSNMTTSNPSQTSYMCTAFNVVDGERKELSKLVSFGVSDSSNTNGDTSSSIQALTTGILSVIIVCLVPVIAYMIVRVYRKVKARRLARVCKALYTQQTTEVELQSEFQTESEVNSVFEHQPEFVPEFILPSECVPHWETEPQLEFEPHREIESHSEPTRKRIISYYSSGESEKSTEPTASEGTYTQPLERSTNVVQEPSIYSQLHLYANVTDQASDNIVYANDAFVELMQKQSKDNNYYTDTCNF